MKITEYDGLTDTQTERDMTPDEIAELEKFRKKMADEQAALDKLASEAKAKKAATLSKLGLTEDELAALIG